MITVLNNETTEAMRGRYTDIFKRAYNDLSENNKLNTDDENRGKFTDLAHYYAHMLDYLEIGKPIYLLLPLDEGHFVIDANTRKIEIPPEFKTCGGVTNDNLCEIATFTMDRYFDYVDLANPKVKIIVQWKTSNGKQGLTKITLIDLETFFDEGKIRFGWPITKDITEVAGTVQFSVQFFITGENDEKIHILNTLPETLVIKQGLEFNKETEITQIDVANDIFKSFVSNNPGTVSDLPTVVQFDDYTWLLSDGTVEAKKISQSTDTLEISALGYTGDLNDLEYTWYKYNGVDLPATKVSELGLVDAENNSLFTERIDYRPYIKGENEAFPRKDFFVEVEGGGYTAYNGTDWPTDSAVELFLKWSTLVFNPDTKPLENKSDITGKYYVEAKNIKREGLYTHNTTNYCVINSPAKIEYETEQLPNHKFLVNGTTDLSMTLKNSSLAHNPDITNTWTGVNADGNDITTFVTNYDEGTTTCTVYEAGYYTLFTSSLLNRKIENGPVLNVCKITDPVTAPIITASYYGTRSSKPTGEETFDSWAQSDLTSEDWADKDNIPAILQVDGGDFFYLKIDHNLQTEPENSLKTDELSHKWYYSTEQDNYKTEVEITDEYRGDFGLIPNEFELDSSKNYIVLRCNWEDNSSYQFYCKITNKLGDEISTTESQKIQLINKI